MGTSVSVERRVEMHRFVTRLQVLAGHLYEPSPELLDRFDQLGDDIPRAATRVEQLAVGNLLQQAVERLARALNAEPPLARLHRADAQAFRDVVRCLRGTYACPLPAHITDFLELVEKRYMEPDLSVTKAAAGMKLSPCYLTRILRRHTGHGFPWHLHTHRIRRATQLLAQSTMSVKEISAVVGYLRTSQLDRRFHGSMGMTPSEYRRLVPAR